VYRERIDAQSDQDQSRARPCVKALRPEAEAGAHSRVISITSLLAHRTVERRPARLGDAPDDARAVFVEAAPVLPLVDAEPRPTPPARRVGLLTVDRLAQDGLDGRREPSRAVARLARARGNGRGAAPWRQSGAVQRFARVDVGKAGDDALIQERRLQGRSASPQRGNGIARDTVELDWPVKVRTIVVVHTAASPGETGNGTTTPGERGLRRWTALWRRRTSPVVDTDALVAAWKAAWMNGARAHWEAKASGANPHATGQERSAWDAGWRWAQQNPDRRNHHTPRLAHRRRRATDSTAPLTRALQVTAMGVTVFWVSRALHRWAHRAR
jgi:hypothetical protein